jgi:hypothetical protein
MIKRVQGGTIEKGIGVERGSIGDEYEGERERGYVIGEGGCIEIDERGERTIGL